MKSRWPEQGKAPRGNGALVRRMMALAIAGTLAMTGWAQTPGSVAKPTVAPVKTAPAKTATTKPVADEPKGPLPVCSGEMPAPVSVDVISGKSTLIKLPAPITLRTLGDREIAQVRLLSPQTLYILGGSIGSTNMILQDKEGRCTLVDVTVGMDPEPVRAKIAQLMPDEKNVRVTAAADTLVLSGVVADAMKVEYAMRIATAYVRYEQNNSETANQGTGPQVVVNTGARSGRANSGNAGRDDMETRVINMLSVAAPQQVMLEVKVAEVSKQVAEMLGAELMSTGRNGDWTYGILSSFLSGGSGVGFAAKIFGENSFKFDAEKKDGLVKILAQPNVMAISGQEGSFLAGGKVYLPVAQGTTGGASTITLEEKEFGVGLKFTPTVLAGGRINLKVAPEVSEFSREGIAVSAPNTVGKQILPLITTRRATTTVQLLDGQSLVIGGLIKNNIIGNIKAFPILGELPIIGALFRSSDFTSDRSEVLFVVTPRLVKPLAAPVQLPTDSYVEPNRFEFFFGGRLEGTPPQEPQQPAKSASEPGFELK